MAPSSSTLEIREFGSQLKTTCLGFGGGGLSGPAGGYGFGDVSEAQAREALESAFEAGIRLYDTAPIYGFGLSEKRMGDFFHANPGLRNECQVVTKLGVDWDEQQNVSVSNSPETVKRMLSQSLERLKIDSVDVYMIHWPDANTPIADTMNELVKLQQEGLFKSIGVSNFTPEQIDEAEKIARVDVVQSPFSLLSATAEEALLPHCREGKRGFMSYGTLAKGILSGTVTEKRRFEESDVRSRGNKITGQYLAVKEEVEEFLQIAKDMGISGSQLAAAWVLSRSGVSTALCGTKNLSQVQEVVAAARVELDDTVRQRLEALSKSATPKFDQVK